VTETLDEVPLRFWTSSWRSVYDYDTRGAEEMFVDEIARAMGQDPVAFRLAFLKSTRLTTLLKKVAKVGNWGRRMPPGTAQGVSVEPRDKSAGACLVELDASGPGTPRVTKAVIAVDARLPVNPLSIEGQMMGGLSDAISVVFSAGNRIVNGLPIEDGWHQFGWARQGDYPPEVQVFVMPRDDVKPGGIGEIGVPTAVGAIGNAYARATGVSPRQFPIHPVPIHQPVAPGRVATSPTNPLPSRHQLYDY
ncbi:MAG TPA: hypothetical protein VE152_06700, partial [Acidimicrobiales bacterium]|nr:hypothetical protein [Acidimicrobiales bacterium]